METPQNDSLIVVEADRIVYTKYWLRHEATHLAIWNCTTS
jgi:hypothetical protein